MKTVVVALLSVWLFVGCATSDTEPSRGDVLRSFALFMRNFTADADYQLDHILFPLGEMQDVVVANEGKPSRATFSQELWSLKELSDFIIDPKLESGGFTLEEDGSMTFERVGLLTDYVAHYTFRLQDGEWSLVSGYESWGGVREFQHIADQVEQKNRYFISRRGSLAEFVPYSVDGVAGRWDYTSHRKLSLNDIANLSDDELLIMRSEILARYGQIFEEREVVSYFMAQKWYMPLFEDATPYLNKIEKYNIKLIDKRLN